MDALSPNPPAPDPSQGDPPLAGVKVVDFTRILSGPYATMLLADLGAEVVKIERPGSGDETRGWGPPFWRGTSTYFAAVNRGKRSVSIDIADPEGRDLAMDLIAGSDVVVENFRPGVMRRLGLDYPDVREVNEKLVYATINGFGSSGPRAQEAGTEVIVEAYSGLMAMMGVPGGPPVRFGVAMVDIATGLALVSGVLGGLLARTRTGVGRHLEFSLYSTAISVLATVIASACVDPESQESRFGSGHPSIVPYAAFEAIDGWLVLGAVNEPMWGRLCTALDLAELAIDERCLTNERRVANREFVDAAIADRLASLTVEEAMKRLGEEGVLAAPVMTAVEAMRDPQVAALGLLDGDEGVQFSRTPLAQFNLERLAPAEPLGASTAAVLAEAGLDDDHLERLAQRGVIERAGDRIERAEAMPAESEGRSRA